MLIKILKKKFYSVNIKLLCSLFIISMLGLSNIVHANGNAVTRYNYTPDAIYPVKTGLGIVTQIEFGTDEEIISYATGLSDGWLLVKKENIIFLKPKNLNVDTNMIVKTNTRQYMFELRVVSTDWKTLQEAKKEGVHYLIKFNKSGEHAIDNASSQFKTNMSTNITGKKTYFSNYDYTSSNKSSWLIPTKIYDDGKFTYIYLKDLPFDITGNMPSVYASKGKPSDEMLLNFRMEGNIIIIDGTYPILVLRHGTDVVGLRRNYAYTSTSHAQDDKPKKFAD